MTLLRNSMGTRFEGSFRKKRSFAFRRTVVVAFTLVIALAAGALMAKSTALGLVFLTAAGYVLLVLLKGEWLVYLMLLSSILFRYRLEIGPVSLNLLRVLFLAAVASLPLQSAMNLLFAPARVAKPLLSVVALAALFTYGWSQAPADFQATATSHLLIYFFWLALFLFLILFTVNQQRFYGLVKVYVVTSSLLAIYGVYEFSAWLITGNRLPLPFADYAVQDVISQVRFLGIPRVESLTHDTNLLGIYLVMGLLFLLFYWQRSLNSPYHHLTLGVLMLVHGLCVVFTFSRSAILLLIISLSVYFLIRFKEKVVGLAPVLFISLFVLAVLLNVAFPGLFTVVEAAITSRFATEQDAERLLFFSTGVDVFLSSPLAGVGMGDPRLRGATSAVFADTAHSLYLTMLAHYGVVGAIVLAGLLWPMLKRAALTLGQWRPDPLDLSMALAVFVLLSFQLIYDDLFGELFVLPFAILYLWAGGAPAAVSSKQ